MHKGRYTYYRNDGAISPRGFTKNIHDVNMFMTFPVSRRRPAIGLQGTEMMTASMLIIMMACDLYRRHDPRCRLLRQIKLAAPQ